MLLSRSISGTLRIRPILGVIDYQEILVKAVKKEAQGGTIDARRAKRIGGTRRNIITISKLLISYYLYLYNSVHKILTKSQTIN